MVTSRTHFQNTHSSKAFYPPDDIRFCVYSSQIWRQFINLLNKKSKIVDLGCSNGTLLHCLYKLGFKNLSAVDFIDAIPPGFVPDVKFYSKDVVDTGLPPNSYDIVVSTMVIEHVDDQKFVKEIYRLLKPGGIAFITSVLLTTHPWYFYKNNRGVRVLESSHLREYSSSSQFNSLFSNFKTISFTKTPLSYPIIDPFFFVLNKIIKSNYLRNLPTTNPIFKKLRLFRIPIPGYYALEIIIQKPFS